MIIEMIKHKMFLVIKSNSDHRGRMFPVINDNTGDTETTFPVKNYNSGDRGQNVCSHKL